MATWWRGRKLSAVVAAFCLWCAVCALDAVAQPQTLKVSDRGSQRTYSARELLASPAMREITLADAVYHRTMTYQAIPIASLLKTMTVGADDYIQATATDNFSVSIPARLLLNPEGAAGPQAYLAIESAAAPWPNIPGKTTNAGTFYIVWQNTDGARVSSEYWAYHTASLTVSGSPYERWPQLAVGNDVPAADPIRRGLDRFVAVCMACHRFAGAGEADMGPDLATPMNPVDYFQLPALRKLLRDPSSVRKWPEQKMPALDPAALSDADIDAIISWLAYKARRAP